jgi:hypothetical protein
MKISAATAAFLVVAVLEAQAARIPLAGFYGTEDSCEHGSTDLFIGPEGIASLDMGCRFTQVDGSRVTADCEIEGNPLTMVLTIVENRAAGTLDYTDDFGRHTFYRCDLPAS